MVRVKICGITRPEDASHAIDCGADALGFVFYERSPRCLTPERAQRIISELPPFVTTVGLFVNEIPETMQQIADFCSLDALQLHGEEKPLDCRIPGRKVIKALRVRDESSLAGVESYPVSALLLDAWVPGQHGGTGQCCNWELAAKVASDFPVVLAGGLDAGNVQEAIRAVRPYGVDVSSGVESFPGWKDPEKVAEFIVKAKSERFDR